MKRYNLIVIGAGPAGLSAAIEAKSHGLSVAVFDENEKPGGQLFKQIHKFFGSKEHKAKIRGIRIGEELLSDARRLGVDVHLNSVVKGIYYPMKRVTVVSEDHITNYSGDNVLIAAGANENTMPFKGWTLPGVMGAGAAQTMMNLHGVLPGKRVLMVGSGNVGLVVGFQLLQAGCELIGIVEGAPAVGGYGVHAAKIARTGVHFYTSYTVIEANGHNRVESAVIAKVDANFNPIPGTEIRLEVDTICLAVGLTPMSKIAAMTGCDMIERGGARVPKVDELGMTSIEGLYAAGDVSGIEEASSAMITGRLAALGAARKDGYITQSQFIERYDDLKSSLEKLRKGMFSSENKGKKQTHTSEGIELSVSLLEKGYIAEEEIGRFCEDNRKGYHPVIECTQNIPCNPCQDACRAGCIYIGSDITALPKVHKETQCTNCGMCVAACSGQAIFIVNEDYEPGYASVTIPYEFLPLPKAGERGTGLDRSGKSVCDAIIADVKTSKAFDKTALVTLKVPKEMSMKVRFYRKGDGFCE